MFRKSIYLVTAVNILFQAIYLTVGKYATSELGGLKYVFYIFRPEYMVVSGVVAVLITCALLVLIIKSMKSVRFCDIAVLMLNVEYIIYYFSLLMKN